MKRYRATKPLRKKAKGKGKGAGFERFVCKQLSLWLTHGKKEDCFWRSAMSGGRATVGRKGGKDLARQAGDVCAVSPEGHKLTDRFYIECKFYRDLKFSSFILNEAGPLALFWRETVREAVLYNRSPLLIARSNRQPTIILAGQERLQCTVPKAKPIATVWAVPFSAEIFLFDEFVKLRCAL